MPRSNRSTTWIQKQSRKAAPTSAKRSRWRHKHLGKARWETAHSLFSRMVRNLVAMGNRSQESGGRRRENFHGRSRDGARLVNPGRRARRSWFRKRRERPGGEVEVG